VATTASRISYLVFNLACVIPIYCNQFSSSFRALKIICLRPRARNPVHISRGQAEGSWGRTWWQVAGEASFPSAVPPLPRGMSGKGLGARSWGSPCLKLLSCFLQASWSTYQFKPQHRLLSRHLTVAAACDLLPISCSTVTTLAAFLCCNQHQNCSAYAPSASKKRLVCLKASLIACEFP